MANTTLNSPTLAGQEENQAAKKLREDKKQAKMDELDKNRDRAWQSRLDQAKDRARTRGVKGGELNRLVGARAVGKVKDLAKRKIARGANGFFIALLLIALLVDFLEYLDMGVFSSIVNLGVYVLVTVGGFIAWFFKSNNKHGIFNLLKGQLFKYLILPLFEMIPLVNLLPFWTGTVIMMWFKVNRERKKMMDKEEAAEKKAAANQPLEPEYA